MISIAFGTPRPQDQPKSVASSVAEHCTNSSPEALSWESIRQRDEESRRQWDEEQEIKNWLLAGDDNAALALMKKYLPSHRSAPNRLTDVPLNDPFFPIRVLGVARRRAMNRIIDCLEKGEDAEALRLMKNRFHLPQEEYEPCSGESVQ